MRRVDGSVQSANVPSYSKLAQTKKLDHSIYRCMVTNVYYTDDPKNKTFQNKQVTYDVVILGGPREGQFITNVKAMSQLGGEFNYSERVFRKLEAPLSGPGKKPIAEQVGDIVYVGFIQGSTSAAVILGAGTSPLDKTKTGATKADGPRLVHEYNGVFDRIDKNGNLSKWIKGGSFDAERGVFVPNEEDAKFIVKEEYSAQNETLTRTYKSGLKVTEDGANDKVSVATKAGLKVDTDGKGDKVTITTKGGSVLTVDGTTDKHSLVTAGGVEATLDGSANTLSIKAGTTEILIDGASGTVSIKGDIVEVGKTPADLAVLFTELATAFASHTHMVSSVGAPTSPPMAPLPSSVGSQTIKIAK